MSYLVDTNVLSEVRKPPSRGDARVRAWFARQPPSRLYVSVISILEIETGIARLDGRDDAQAERLREWLTDGVLEGFRGRILPVDVPVALRSGAMHVPNTRAAADALIAGTALTHGLTVATRNVDDFVGTGVDVVDPWAA